MALDSGTILRRGFARRCPVCGSRGVFRRWLHMRACCPRCAFRFKRQPGQWLGSWFLNVCVTQALVVLVLVGFGVIGWPDVAVGPMVVVAGAVAVLTPVLFFPYSRTIWVAIDLAMRPLELGEGVSPGFELEAELALVRAADAIAGRGGPDPGAE